MPEQTDVDSIEFKPATGGLVSHTSRMEKGKGDYGMHKREIAVHPSLAHAMRHMKVTLGASFGKKEASVKGKKKSESMKKA